jgi:hypothetical protein
VIKCFLPNALAFFIANRLGRTFPGFHGPYRALYRIFIKQVSSRFPHPLHSDILDAGFVPIPSPHQNDGISRLRVKATPQSARPAACGIDQKFIALGKFWGQDAVHVESRQVGPRSPKSS